MNDTLPKKIQPFNRHLLIVPDFGRKKEEKPEVLLPDGYNPPKERYLTADVLAVAKDCTEHIRSLKYRGESSPTIVVDRSMIEEIKIFNKSYYFILENHVVGAVREFHEN